MPRKSSSFIKSLSGFKDILPVQQDYWEYFFTRAIALIRAHGFKRIDTPVLENAQLYYRAIKKQADVLKNKAYIFENRDKEEIILRPAFAPSLVRAYVEHNMLNKPQPIKLYTSGVIFSNNEAPSEPRHQFYQLNLMALGSVSPVLDAQLIILTYHLLELLGLPIRVHINSLGDKECRNSFITKFKQYLSSGGRKKELCDNCKMKYSKNTLQILNCQEETCRRVLAGAPQLVDFLNEEPKKHFMQVLEYLDDLDIKYELDTSLVCNFDYYNRTVFKIYLANKQLQGSQTALAVGGRYDDLVEILSGHSAPAVGLSIDVEQIVKGFKELKIKLPKFNNVDVFIAQLGAEARKEAFKLHQKLFMEGISVAEFFSENGLKAQLEKASQLEAKITLIIGQKELLEHTIIIRDMQSGIQEIVNYDKIIEQVKKRVEAANVEIKKYTLHQPAEAVISDDNNSTEKDKKKTHKELLQKKKEFQSSLDLEDDNVLKDLNNS